MSPAADPVTLIRRATLDLTGLPPSPDEIDAFVRDRRPDAWGRVIDRLLNSPRYGERWAQYWLDVVRYADTHGFEVNTPRENAWPYRDYVIRCFNEDTPYDDFVRQQLAGDVLHADEATGFLVASAVLLPGQIGKDDESKRLARQDELDEMIVATGASFLGLTIGCARCHDHKFDPITSRDYYAMQAFFAGVDFGERPINDPDYPRRQKQADRLAAEIAELQNQLAKMHEPVSPGLTRLIDERDSQRTVFLVKENGTGSNPAGTKRGYRDDPGTPSRLGNVSGGKYTWWNNVPGQDVMYYRPQVSGEFDLWISWGVHGSGVHTRDARYILDPDGDLKTRDDQKEIARVDQYYPAGVDSGETEQVPIWSGFRYVGRHRFGDESVVLLRGGKTGNGITADAILLQEVTFNPAPNGQSQQKLPRLRRPVDFGANVERFDPLRARYIRFTVLGTDSENFREPCIDELEVFSAGNNPKNVALARGGATVSSSGNYGDGTGIHQLKHVNDGRYGNSWSWISNRKGGGWVQIELPGTPTIERIVWGRDRLGQFRDRLAIEYQIEVSTDGTTWRKIASHEDRAPFGSPGDPSFYLVRNADGKSGSRAKEIGERIANLKSQRERMLKRQLVYAGKFRKPDRTFVLRRGNPEMKGDEVSPRVPELFPIPAMISDPGTEPSRRLALANWIASPKNPLTARVIVNRIWAGHFGRGLVETPSDFGVNAAPPTHPDLLDWLAIEFIRHDWSIKWLHRTIMTSNVYRQKALIRSGAARLDAANRYYWRFGSRRLEGEAIRDSMLKVSGELNLAMGGRGFDFFKTRGGLSGFPEVETFSADGLRRMIYAHRIRMERVPVFGVFDCPDAGQPMPLRSRSTTAIQALNLFNSSFVLRRAERFAERVKSNSEPEIESQVTTCFRLALGRKPNRKEMDAACNLVSEHGLPSLCRVLFNSNEFLFLP